MNGWTGEDEMAACITTTCPRCGTVELQRDDLLLVVDPHASDSWYQFDCTSCGCCVVKDAPPAVVSALSFADVPTSVLPAEAHERRFYDGQRGPVGADDLLDAVLLLASTDDVVALATANL